MTTLQSRVTKLLSLRGLSQAEATRRGEFKNKAFINDIVRGAKINVRGDSLQQLARALDTTEKYLIGATDSPDAQEEPAPKPPAAEYRDAPDVTPVFGSNLPRDVPIRGICVGGSDADFTMNGDTGDYVRRPPSLEGKRGVYALYVVGTSMYPAYREGDLLYVDPHRTPAVGEDAVIELHPETPELGEPGRGFVKRLKKRNGSKMIFEQFNPVQDLIFQNDEIKNLHRVIPMGEILGF